LGNSGFFSGMNLLPFTHQGDEAEAIVDSTCDSQ
jgi:hypothetical protein